MEAINQLITEAQRSTNIECKVVAAWTKPGLWIPLVTAHARTLRVVLATRPQYARRPASVSDERAALLHQRAVALAGEPTWLGVTGDERAAAVADVELAVMHELTRHYPRVVVQCKRCRDLATWKEVTDTADGDLVCMSCLYQSRKEMGL